MNMYLKPVITEEKQNVNLLTFPDGKKLYLIGTAHVSSSSIDLVEETIREVQPDTICVELDEQRHKAMTKKKLYEDLDIIEIIRKKQLFFFIGQFIMASYQRKISEKTGSKPGMEFRKAIEMAEITGARLILADRNIGTTLKRAYRMTPFWHKIRFLASLFAADDSDFDDIDIEELKTQDAIINIVKTFEDELPTAKKVLIDERDQYLTAEIQANLGTLTVAVVGAGHVPGMLNEFQNRIGEEKKLELNIVPPPSSAGKIIPWIIPLIFIALIAWGFMSGRKDVAQDVVIYWIAVNGTLTALGCLLAFAHPLTMLTGFIAAPITSLNPTIGAGFVTAIVQTFLVKPRVRDFEEIQEKTLRFRNWWTNRVTKIFLVFILSSIGSSIGTFVALPALRKLFTL